MIIKNRRQLATSRLREQALDIIEAGIRRVLPKNIMRSAVNYDHITRIIKVQKDTFSAANGRIFVIGGGKASGLMAEALENIIGAENIADGAVNYKGGAVSTRKIKVVAAGHPLPDRRGVDGVKEILALKRRYSICEGDIVICLISGGGSALMPCPVDGVSLEDKQEITRLLLASGAEISEINIVRKHLSQIKGGRLGAFYAPATVISLILSDVIGNDLSTIASGPTFPDPSTFSDAIDVLKRYSLLNKLPKSVTDFLNKGMSGEVTETPKALDNCYNYIIGDNGLALEAMADKATELDFKPFIISASQKSDAADVARLRAGEVLGGKYAGYNALLIGGETTVTLPPQAGKGGRNQHYVAVSLLAMKQHLGEWLVASVGSDGSDYLPDVAGAIVDSDSIDRIQSMGIDVQPYIANFDSNTLLGKTGNSLIVTGDTGTNVGDVILYLTA